MIDRAGRKIGIKWIYRHDEEERMTSIIKITFCLVSVCKFITCVQSTYKIEDNFALSVYIEFLSCG